MTEGLTKISPAGQGVVGQSDGQDFWFSITQYAAVPGNGEASLGCH